jgi:hypothetical protein
MPILLVSVVTAGPQALKITWSGGNATLVSYALDGAGTTSTGSSLAAGSYTISNLKSATSYAVQVQNTTGGLTNTITVTTEPSASSTYFFSP